MKYVLVLSLFSVSLVFAQPNLSGVVIANDTQGFIVIACLVDFETNDCNYEKTLSKQVNADGSYTFSGLEAGQYLVIAWRDTNGSGDLEEGQDEMGYYVDANGELATVTPPSSNINIQIGNSLSNTTPVDNQSATSSANPLNNSSSENTPTYTPGVIPAQYVGVWVDDTTIRGFSMTNTAGGIDTSLGQTITTTTLSNVGGRVLRIQGDGTYTYFMNDLNRDCLITVSSQGTVQITDTTFTLSPTQKRETQQDAGNSDIDTCELLDQQLTPTPEVYPLEFRESTGLYGWKTYEMSWLAESENRYWVFSKAVGERPAVLTEQVLPYGFVLGQEAAYTEIAGTWFASGNSEFAEPEDLISVDFYDAATGQVSVSQYASKLTLSGNGYEMITYRPDVFDAPLCAKNLLLIERGTVAFAVTDIYDDKTYIAGTVVFTPSESLVTDELLNCELDDYKRTLSLPLTPRYLTWNVRLPQSASQLSSEDQLEIICPFEGEQTEWLFLMCPAENLIFNGFKRQ